MTPVESRTPPVPAASVERKPDWWTRNWKWFVPAVLLACCLMAVGIFAAIMGIMKSSDAYVGAMERVRAAPQAVEALGTPIEVGLFVLGNVKVSGGSGEAELAIPVHGPKGKATVYVGAKKEAGLWHFETLVVATHETKQRIDLSEAIGSKR